MAVCHLIMLAVFYVRDFGRAGHFIHSIAGRYVNVI